MLASRRFAPRSFVPSIVFFENNLGISKESKVVLLVVGAGAVLTYAVKPPTSWPGCASSTLFGPGDPSFLRKTPVLHYWRISVLKPVMSCVSIRLGAQCLRLSIASCVLGEAIQELRMGCSSVGWLDSLILGVNHVYIAGSNVGPTAAANFGFDPEAALGKSMQELMRSCAFLPANTCRAWSRLSARCSQCFWGHTLAVHPDC